MGLVKFSGLTNVTLSLLLLEIWKKIVTNDYIVETNCVIQQLFHRKIFYIPQLTNYPPMKYVSVLTHTISLPGIRCIFLSVIIKDMSPHVSCCQLYAPFSRKSSTFSTFKAQRTDTRLEICQECSQCDEVIVVLEIWFWYRYLFNAKINPSIQLADIAAYIQEPFILSIDLSNLQRSCFIGLVKI